MLTPATPRLLRPREAAEMLTVSERKLWTMTKNGNLRAVRIGRSVRYDVSELMAFIERQKVSK